MKFFFNSGTLVGALSFGLISRHHEKQQKLIFHDSHCMVVVYCVGQGMKHCKYFHLLYKLQKIKVIFIGRFTFNNKTCI